MRTWVASDPYAKLGTIVDNGQCMRHVQVVAGVPHSSALRRGARVRFTELPRGTTIATFNSVGRYANATDGSSHICFFISKEPDGLRVVDQWVGREPPGVQERVIRYKGGIGKPVDDGDAYCIVETEEAPAAVA
jgi:hypothetical protein